MRLRGLNVRICSLFHNETKTTTLNWKQIINQKKEDALLIIWFHLRDSNNYWKVFFSLFDLKKKRTYKQIIFNNKIQKEQNKRWWSFWLPFFWYKLMNDFFDWNECLCLFCSSLSLFRSCWAYCSAWSVSFSIQILSLPGVNEDVCHLCLMCCLMIFFLSSSWFLNLFNMSSAGFLRGLALLCFAFAI